MKGKSSNFWEAYYSKESEGDSPLVDNPSSFAKKCVSYLGSHSKILEMGCGNGRDARLLGSKAAYYMGIDASPAAVEYCQKNVSLGNFQCLDMTANDLVQSIGEKFDMIYCRFVLHSIDEMNESRVFATANSLLKDNGIICFEARSVKDPRYGIGEPAGKHAFMDTHFRRFINPLEWIESLSDCFILHELNEEYVAANFGSDKAVVVRVIASKRNFK